jgi:Protein of unknown function (DUF3830)
VTDILITVGSTAFKARWEESRSPQTCAAFRRLLPYSQSIIHARWSGEACWIPMGTFDLGAPPENPTSTPAPGEILFYPGGISETEILFPYGTTRFSSVAGELKGNHFLTIVENLESLADLGRQILMKGSMPVGFANIPH